MCLICIENFLETNLYYFSLINNSMHHLTLIPMNSKQFCMTLSSKVVHEIQKFLFVIGPNKFLGPNLANIQVR